MKPLEERTPDVQYRNILKEILENGEFVESKQEEPCKTLMVPMPMRFSFENGFPMITERNLNAKAYRIPPWKQAINEIFAFINGVRTQDELEKRGCLWWRHWVTKEKCEKRGLEPGDLGPGSYGAAFHDFPTSEGAPFNQFEEVLAEIAHNPNLRTFFISPWIPQYIPRRPGRIQKVVVAPCHGWIQIRILNNKMTLVMIQRSCDMVLGVPNNTVQYAALAMAISHVIKYPIKEFVHVLIDAHIYEKHIEAAEKMIKRDPRPFPTMKIDTSVTNLFDFNSEHFHLSDYNPHPGIKGLTPAI